LIGGVEAVNDIYFCAEVGADGIIAPMVESKFAIKKFLDSVNKLKLRKKPHLSINIETVNAVNNIEEIIKLAKGNINNITIGRSDLAASHFKDDILQNSQIIENKIFLISKKTSKSRLTCTVGGGIDMNTIKLYRNNNNIKLVNKLETRKVIFFNIVDFKNITFLVSSLLTNLILLLFRYSLIVFISMPPPTVHVNLDLEVFFDIKKILFSMI
jgi:hypothetical protein